MPRKKGSILIVDDNEDILTSLRLLLKQQYESIQTEKDPGNLPSILQSTDPTVILLDMNFSAGINTGNEGLYWLRRILETDPEAVVIMITAYGDIELAVNAMREGATDFILKPWENEKLLATVQSGYELRKSRTEVKKLKSRQQQLTEDTDKSFAEFIGESAAMEQVFQTISKVAATDANILITGENGTGKELVARAIHRQSKRSNEAFVSVDMGALTESLFESEMFGHVKGAFTDAREDRSGRFEVASGGTLFLDEIGNLSLPMQAKLLTALQNRKITRLGSNKEIAVDIRLVSATNRNLAEMIEADEFREDLLFRMNTIHLHLPPLRERGNDILLLADFFLQKYAVKYGKNGIQLSATAESKLLDHHWPGNVRELQHTIEKAVILSEGKELKGGDFFFSPLRTADKMPATLNLEEVEKETIARAMRKHRGNMTHVAKELGISRSTLYTKIDKYGL